MIFHRSTRSIVNGKRHKMPMEASVPADDRQPVNPAESVPDAAQTAPAPQNDTGTPTMNTANLLRWVIPVGCVILVLIVSIVLLAIRPGSRNDDITPEPVVATLPDIGAGQSIVSIQADAGLSELAKPGDVVQLYSIDGADLPALRYVQVYQSADDGRLLLIVDDTQAATIVREEISDRVLLIAHEDSDRAEELLELQDRINDPQITLTLQPTAEATPGVELRLEFQTEIQPTEAPLPEILWESDNPKVAVVHDGVIHTVGVGSAVITARCGDVEANCTINVEIPLEEIQLDRQTAAIAVGETLRLTATPLPQDATRFSVTWSSEDPTVATVAEDGTITGVAPGEVIITASSGEISFQCRVTVGYHAEVVQLDRENISLAIGQTYTLKPTVYPSADLIDAMQFESSNSKVVKVANDGTVTALTAGKAYITFRCGNATAKCLVIVTAAETQH